MFKNPEEWRRMQFQQEIRYGTPKRRYYFFISFAFLSVIFFFISCLTIGYITNFFDMRLPNADSSYYESMFRTISLIALLPALLAIYRAHSHYTNRSGPEFTLFPYRILFNTLSIMKFGFITSILLLTLAFLTEWRAFLKPAVYITTASFVIMAAHFAWQRAQKRERSEHSRIFDWEAIKEDVFEELPKYKYVTTTLYNAGVFLMHLAFTLFVLFVVKPMVKTDILHSPLFKPETFRSFFLHPLFWLFTVGLVLRIVAFFKSFGYARQK